MGLKCKYCSELGAYAELLLQTLGITNSTTILDKFLNQTCNKLPPPADMICDTFVLSFGKPVVDCIVNGTNSTKCCQLAHMCPAAAELPQAVTRKCKFCVELAGYAMLIFHNLGINNVSMIIDDFENITCNKLPSPFKDVCIAFVSTYGAPVVKCILTGSNATTCCEEAHLCPVNNTLMEKKKPVAQPSFSPTTCKYCTELAVYAEAAVKNLGITNVSQIIALFENYTCNKLPPPYNSFCNLFVGTYGTPIVTCIVNGDNTTTCCMAADLCPLPAAPAVKVAQQAASYCDYCKQLADVAEELAEAYDITDVTQIITEFEKQTCNLLPNPFQQFCDAFVQMYATPVVKCIVSGTDSTICCQDVGLCGANKRKVAARRN